MSGCDIKQPPMITSITCNQCDVVQPPSEKCVNCDLVFSTHYCDKCILWTKKEIHHCDDCGFCRVGKAEETFHCSKCDACFNKRYEDTHECLRIPFKTQKCAICCEDLHNAQRATQVLRCSHGGRLLCFFYVFIYLRCSNHFFSLMFVYIPCFNFLVSFLLNDDVCACACCCCCCCE